MRDVIYHYTHSEYIFLRVPCNLIYEFLHTVPPMDGIYFYDFLYDLKYFFITTAKKSSPATTIKDKKPLSSDKQEMSSNDDEFKAKTNDENPPTEVREKMTRLNVNDESDGIKKTSTGATSGGGKS